MFEIVLGIRIFFYNECTCANGTILIYVTWSRVSEERNFWSSSVFSRSNSVRILSISGFIIWLNRHKRFENISWPNQEYFTEINLIACANKAHRCRYFMLKCVCKKLRSHSVYLCLHVMWQTSRRDAVPVFLCGCHVRMIYPSYYLIVRACYQV